MTLKKAAVLSVLAIFLSIPSAGVAAESAAAETLATAVSSAAAESAVPALVELCVAVSKGAGQRIDIPIDDGCLLAIISTVGLCVAAPVLCGFAVYATVGICTCFNVVGFLEWVLSMVLYIPCAGLDATGAVISVIRGEQPVGPPMCGAEVPPLSMAVDPECLDDGG